MRNAARRRWRKFAQQEAQLVASVPDLHGKQAGEPVEIPLSGGVVDVAPVATGHHANRMLVVERREPREMHPEMPSRQRRELGRCREVERVCDPASMSTVAATRSGGGGAGGVGSDTG